MIVICIVFGTMETHYYLSLLLYLYVYFAEPLNQNVEEEEKFENIFTQYNK